MAIDDPADERAELAPHRRIQRTERLIEHEEPRSPNEGAGERHPLALPAGERTRASRGELGRPDLLEERRGLLTPRTAPAGRARECDVVEDRPVGQQSASWNTIPICRSWAGTRTPRAGASTSRPASSIDPSRAGRRPASVSRVSDLPMPDWPVSTVMPSPGTSSATAASEVAGADRRVDLRDRRHLAGRSSRWTSTRAAMAKAESTAASAAA